MKEGLCRRKEELDGRKEGKKTIRRKDYDEGREERKKGGRVDGRKAGRI